ncbi:MAG: hypothetical protein OEM49_07810 [Myxococcales bacterium]|nr:hypothetical protein [Myxococcales bacterium]MDH5307102.1 hypothetical protein [Myxococcales bacterium]MDH5565033.1 hypothetical protein [Myxococcales bacterium]
MRLPNAVYAAAMLGWTAAALFAGWIAARVGLGYPPAPRGSRCLRPAEMACVAAVAEAVFPPGGALACSGLEAGIPRYVDGFVAEAPPRSRARMRLLFFLIEHGTLLFPAPGGLRGLRRFSALPLEQRIAVLEGWACSRLFARRLVFASLRAIVTLGFFAHAPVLRALDLAPHVIESPVLEVDLLYPRIGAHPDEIAWTRADLTAPSAGIPLGRSAQRQ